MHLLSFRVFSLQKIECTFDGISIAFFASPNFFETSDSKRLPVKYSSQSDFESLDFDIDWPRGLASLVLTKRNAASGNEIGLMYIPLNMLFGCVHLRILSGGVRVQKES